MRLTHTNSVTPSNGQKPRPALLASIPIPISSRRRAPLPPPSSPIRYHHSITEDDLLFAMSPDQVSSDTPFTSRAISSYSEHLRLSSSSARLQKFLNNQTIPRPFLSTKADPYPDEPFMYSVPNIKSNSRPQTPKRNSGSSTTSCSTPTARRHALLKPYVSATCPPRSSATCSSSQTSEDESEFDCHLAKSGLLTSTFSRSPSATTSTTATSSSAGSSVDGLLTTTTSSYPLSMSDDILPVPRLSPAHFSAEDGKGHRKANSDFFGHMRGALPSPSASRHRPEEKHIIASKSSSHAEKYLREVDTKGGSRMDCEKLGPDVVTVQVIRGRPRERNVSRGVGVSKSSVLGEMDS